MARAKKRESSSTKPRHSLVHSSTVDVAEHSKARNGRCFAEYFVRLDLTLRGFELMAKKRGRDRDFKPLGKLSGAIPGFGAIQVEHLQTEHVEGDASSTLAETGAQLLESLRARDTVSLIAKSGEQLLRELHSNSLGPGPSGLEQVHVELLQAFALAAGSGKCVPTSPRSMVKIWSLARQNLAAYLADSEPDHGAGSDEMLAWRIRMRTIFYRNVFHSDDAADIVPSLVSRMDAAAESRLGYRMSDFAKAMFSIFAEVGERLSERIAREAVLREGVAVDGIVTGMLENSAWAQRLWRLAESCRLPLERRGWAGFQLAEMLCMPLFIFSRRDLLAQFGEPVTQALFSRSLALGSLSDEQLSRVYLTNPIWEHPFIKLDPDTLFLPLPVLIISFPFMIIEALIGSDTTLNRAYAAARTLYLEEDVERIIRRSLPSAAVYRGVNWIDPDTKVKYEHDVVAVLGMQVLIFEAKSGKLAAAARRGGLKSIRTNFENLFIEPGRQASRLEALLASRREDVTLVDKSGEPVRFERSGPSVVHKFGVCIEQFASITSSRRLFRDMELLRSDEEWAPILTLGELRMISDWLDTEVSFLHYLTRRATADDVLDFIADEQDLLSMYLMNGFSLDSRALEGHQVMFLHADAAVRGRASPRENRREFVTLGITLPSMWALIAKEIYETEHRHRFDILISILNQHFGPLDSMARRVRRWRSGGGLGKGNTMSSRTAVGKRVYVVIVHMAKEHPLSEQAWRDQARLIAFDLGEKLGATDCVVVLRTRRSKLTTFDGIAFFRFHRPFEGVHLGSVKA